MYLCHLKKKKKHIIGMYTIFITHTALRVLLVLLIGTNKIAPYLLLQHVILHKSL